MNKKKQTQVLSSIVAALIGSQAFATGVDVEEGAEFSTFGKLGGKVSITNAGTVYINSDIPAEVTLKDGSPAGKWIERPIVEEIANPTNDGNLETSTRYPEVDKLYRARPANVLATKEPDPLANYEKDYVLTELGDFEGVLDLVDEVNGAENVQGETYTIEGGEEASPLQLSLGLGNIFPENQKVNYHNIRFTKHIELSGDNSFLQNGTTEIGQGQSVVTVADSKAMFQNDVVVRADSQLNLNAGDQIAMANGKSLILQGTANINVSNGCCFTIPRNATLKLIPDYPWKTPDVFQYPVSEYSDLITIQSGNTYTDGIFTYTKSGDNFVRKYKIKWFNPASAEREYIWPPLEEVSAKIGWGGWRPGYTVITTDGTVKNNELGISRKVEGSWHTGLYSDSADPKNPGNYSHILIKVIYMSYGIGDLRIEG